MPALQAGSWVVGVVLGLSNKDIADVYGRSARTVKCDRTMLTRRLDVCASVDLGRLAKDAMVAIEELEASRGGSRNRLSSRGSAVWHGLWSNAS